MIELARFEGVPYQWGGTGGWDFSGVSVILTPSILPGMRLDPDDPLSEVITIKAAADSVGRAPATLRDWIRNGDLNPIRVGYRTYTTERAARDAEREIWRRGHVRDHGAGGSVGMADPQGRGDRAGSPSGDDRHDG